MKYQVYEQEDGLLLTTKKNADKLRLTGNITNFDKLLYEFNAATPEEASAIFNLRQGFETYKPIGIPGLCPKCKSIYYPEGSGVCWRCGKIN